MQKGAPDYDNFSFLDKKQLVNLKTKAIRSGAWFKALQRIDRVLLDLTIRVVGNVRSAKLAKSIFTLTRKLKDAMESSFSRQVRRIGWPLAQKTILTAQKLGNQLAKSWIYDSSFAIFLAVMHFNDAEGSK